jgi:hypothetical protein
MAATINEAFEKLLSGLTPSGVETDAAKRHRASIEDSLRATFGLEAFFQSGSFGHGTSIRNHSDVDRFAVLPMAAFETDSNIVLRRVAFALAGRFPRTGVRINAPAIRCPFGGTDRNEATEVIPAFEALTVVPNRYLIPDARGGWMLAAPLAHNDYVNAADQRLGGRVKPLIRLLKAWKYFNKLPVKSFYLEILTAAYASRETSIVYAVDVSRLLGLLLQSQLGPLNDPIGVSAPIRAVETQSELNRCVFLLRSHAPASAQAWTDEANGRVPAAWGAWRRIFAHQFPTYWI